MQRRIHLSWVVLVAGGLWGISISETKGTFGGRLATALFVAYIAWALYWGAPAAWRWCRTSDRARSCARALTSRGWGGIAFMLSVAFLGGYFYSVLGGGVYQFVKCWKNSASGP